MIKFGKFFGPMLLKERAKPFDDETYLYELKYDGIRSLIHAGPRSFRIYTRRGVDITKQYPELQKIQSLVKKDVIFDGEIVFFEDGNPNFSKLSTRNKMRDDKKIKYASLNDPVCFVAFDILYEDKSLIDVPLIKRKDILEKYPNSDIFIKTEYITGYGTELFAKVKDAGLEGIVAKKRDSKYYVEKRSDEWIKIKNFQRGTFYVGGYMDNKVKGSLLLGEYRGKSFYFVGKVALSKTNAFYKELKAVRPLRSSPFKNLEKRDVTYVAPERRVSVTFIERTPSGNLRQPVFRKVLNTEKR